MTTPDHPNYSAAAIAYAQQELPSAFALVVAQAVTTIWQQLLNLVLGLLTGIGGKLVIALGIPKDIHITLPTETFSAFGKSWTLAAKIGNGNLTITLTPL